MALDILMGGNKGPLPVTSKEEKELRRVFLILCNYQRKTRILLEIEELNDLLSGNTRTLTDAKRQDQIVNYDIYMNNATATHDRIQELEQEFQRLAARTEDKISVGDVTEMLKRLGQRPVRKDVEEMLWEVDEDLDQHINWTEFKLMFTRNILDQTGLEPARMFNLTQFLIYDENENGMVSVDETMKMLFSRYGRANLEDKLKELFGQNMHETGKEGGEISYDKFIEAVHRVQMNTFWSTTKGKNIANKGGLKKKKNDDED
jgi:Ca2+-binding EF-hand superfamily protein